MRRKPSRRRAEYKRINFIDHKLCTGPLHPEGKWVKLPEGWYYRNYKGQRVPRSMCKECEYERRWHGSKPRVEYARIKFAVDELIYRLGKAETARRLGITKQTLYTWTHNQRKRVSYKHATEILHVLRDVRKNGEVRHRDSIRHGSTARGRKEKIPTRNADFNGPDDKEAARARARRRELTSPK